MRKIFLIAALALSGFLWLASSPAEATWPVYRSAYVTTYGYGPYAYGYYGYPYVYTPYYAHFGWNPYYGYAYAVYPGGYVLNPRVNYGVYYAPVQVGPARTWGWYGNPRIGIRR